jgi:hypothetical protein
MSGRAEVYNASAIMIQCLIRKFIARRKVQRVTRETWQRVFETRVKLYFWYNKVTGASKWTVPFSLSLYTTQDHKVLI